MRLMFIGDTHGELADMAVVIEKASRLCVDEIIQVGDWGFMWPGYDKYPRLQEMLVPVGIVHSFIDGNHDDPRLRTIEGGAIADNISYMNRGSVKRYRGGLTIGFLGGAPSIDRKYRRPGFSWWPEEVITQGDVDMLVDSAAGEPLDILVTHDAPMLPPGIREITDDPVFSVQAAESLGFVLQALKRTRAKLLIHGHYHRRYTTELAVYTGPEDLFHTRIEGLAHCARPIPDCCLIVDVGPADDGADSDPCVIDGIAYMRVIPSSDGPTHLR